MTTRAELFAQSFAVLRATSNEARLDATRIIEYVLDVGSAKLIAFGERKVSDESVERVQALVERRRQGEPIAYLCGEAWFYGRPFFVDPRVLVPRPETELLIELALHHLRTHGRPTSPQIVDIGTGSGAIAVTLAVELPQAAVLGIDVSQDALTVANSNCRRHKLEARLSFTHSDLLRNVHAGERFDLIAANLPYLRSDEVPARPDPLGFEPVLALDGGADGLDCYRKLFAELPARCNPGAVVLLEAAPPTMPLLEKLAGLAFPEAKIQVRTDFAGLARILTMYF
jgi:release factor glutamine methyltransferase